MIALEYEIENALRVAIRAAIDLKAVTVPELAACKIIGSRLDSEDQTAEGQDMTGIAVYLEVWPNTFEGANTSAAIYPLRSANFYLEWHTHPDDDVSKSVFNGLENAVRGVFESIPPAFTLPVGINFGGVKMPTSNQAEYGDRGKLGAVIGTIELSITG